METLTKEKKSYVKLGFSGKETQELVSSMNLLLADFHVFYQKLRNYHWNVTGGDFFDLHDKFEELYTESFTYIDEIAERIRVFGMTPLSTFTDYLKNATIKETGTDLSADEMVNEVIQDLEILDSSIIDAIDKAADYGDVATMDMMNKMAKSLEKHHWMLKAFMSK
ncbi:MAG: Dps family protein [Bacteroidota bacterium]